MNIASELISSIEAGQILDLTPRPTPKPIPDYKRVAPQVRRLGLIDADLLRDILLGVPLSLPLNAGNTPGTYLHTPVKIASPGIRIKGATITGHLRLDDLSLPGGGPIPALYFEECWFDCEEGISLNRSHLRSLSLINCRCAALHAQECIIDGPVLIPGIVPPPKIFRPLPCSTQADDSDTSEAKPLNRPEPEPIELTGSFVVLTGAHIGGHVYCANASFQAPPRDNDKDKPFVPNSTHSRYALDLRAAVIGGSVTLRPNVNALGGVSFNLAQIQGSVWANGAKLTAGEDAAFSADYSEIQGSLYLRAYDPSEVLDTEAEATTKDKKARSKERKEKRSRRFIARGEVSLFATRLGGSLYMEGSNLRRKPETKSSDAEHGSVLDGEQQDGLDGEGFRSLDASNATIGGDCNLSGWYSRSHKRLFYRFKADGEVLLFSTVIRNDTIFQGATLTSVRARNIKVGGDFDCSVYEKKFVQAAVKAGKLRTTVHEIHIEGAVVGGDLLMYGARLGREGCAEDLKQGIFARGSKIGGNCHLSTFPYEGESKDSHVRFECHGRIHLQEGSIGNSLVMEGAEIIWTRSHPHSVAVDFSGTSIGGHAKFQTWQRAEAKDTVCKSSKGEPSCLPFVIHAGETALRLAGTKITQKLILNGARITASRFAINASNAEVGGKASLHTYSDRNRPEREPDVCAEHFDTGCPPPAKLKRASGTRSLEIYNEQARYCYPFVAHGQVSFASAVIKLGLSMTGAKLRACRGEAAVLEDGLHRDPSKQCQSVALDLTQARIRTVRLDDIRVVGQTDLRHADIDIDVLSPRARFEGRFIADYAKIGARMDLTDVAIWSGSVRNIYAEYVAEPKRVFDEIAKRHAGRQTEPDLSLHSTRVGGTLIVGSSKGTDGLVVFSKLDSEKQESSCPYRSAATSATAVGELDLSSILSAPSRWLAICQSASLAVSPAGFTGGFAMKNACAIVLQVKEFFYRLEQISIPLGIA